ncbi:MAG TPA: alanine racemase [Vicinamibacterales bacterium]|nr:alanine racemase [Vicinamibacterales bacterium]
MTRPTVARVDLAAIESNFHAISAFLAAPLTRTSHVAGRTPDAADRIPDSADRIPHAAVRTPDAAPRAQEAPPRIIAVVKANAYGHGAVPVGLALERAGAAMLACADIEEGVVLRRGSVRIPILVFGALGISDLEGVFEYGLTPTISTPSAARALAAKARGLTPAVRTTGVRPRSSDYTHSSGTPGDGVRPRSSDYTLSGRSAANGVRPRTLGYHLKIDTGMNRLGFRHDNLDRTLPELAASADLEVEAVYTHFATADDPESTHFSLQRERFEHALHTLDALGLKPRYRHAANSAALLRDERTWYDFVRPGLLLYGVVPPPLASTLPLRPALSLHSRIVHVKGIRPGEATGYGLKTPFSEPATVAVVPAGYADGLDRRLAGNGQMLVRGRRAPIVGSVCMDMTMIDVTGMDVSPGDEVVIVGEQERESIGVREMAAAIGTIPYELLCRVGSRIERVYDNP